MYVCICNAIRESDLRRAARHVSGDAETCYAALGKPACCGTCLDFRIVVSMRADAYSQWKARNHYPEAEVLQALSASPACSDVQSQLLSIMDCS